MKIKLLAAALIIILAAGVWWGLGAVQASKNKQANQVSQAANLANANNPENSSLPATDSGAPKLDNQGDVEVTVTWRKESSDASLLKFAVSMNNHMLNLDNYDFSSNVQLKIGNTVVPAVVKVFSKSGEGHHVSSEIGVQSAELSKMKPGGKFTLILKDLAGIPARNFSWVY